MSTTVTPEAPVASNLEEALETGFLPDDPHYRLTGEFKSKEEKPAQQTEVEDPATPGDKGDETAAASEAAPQQEETKGPAQTRTAKTSENRWQKRERELKELRDEVARLKAQPRSDTQQTSQPATETKPKANAKPNIDDVDPKTGKPRFANWKEYEDAKDKWNREEARREFQEESSKTAAEQEQQRQEQTVRQTVHERVEKARKQYADYDEVTKDIVARKDQFGNEALFFPPGGHIDRFLFKSEKGADLLYHIAKNFDDPAIQSIFARDQSGKNYLMNGVDQLYELARIEHSLPKQNASASTPATPVTQAGRPPHQVSGKGTVAKDAVEQALEDGDFETYKKAQDAKDLARLKRK